MYILDLGFSTSIEHVEEDELFSCYAGETKFS